MKLLEDQDCCKGVGQLLCLFLLSPIASFYKQDNGLIAVRCIQVFPSLVLSSWKGKKTQSILPRNKKQEHLGLYFLSCSEDLKSNRFINKLTCLVDKSAVQLKALLWMQAQFKERERANSNFRYICFLEVLLCFAAKIYLCTERNPDPLKLGTRSVGGYLLE